MKLGDLGSRICIMGPSNSGKSTLANAIARKRNLDPIHLDQLRHRPHTDWEMRPNEEFQTLHDAALAGERWVMEGNYSRLLPQRLARATGFILLDVSTGASLLRYLRRSWFKHDRRGGLPGGKDSVKWDMLYHIAIRTRGNRSRYAQLFEEIDLPKIQLFSGREITKFYRTEGLTR
ncbi:hypothetical protein LMIY3S_05122 [Labrys miyagiensis]